MKTLPLALALVGLAPWLSANDTMPLQIITLKDNSVVRARVSESIAGFYIAQSPTLGDMKIPVSQVISIQNEATTNPLPRGEAGSPRNNSSNPAAVQNSMGASPTDALKSALASKVQGLVSTPAGMAAIQQFSQNQDLKAILSDPNVMNAIQSGNYEALMKSPAIKKLMDNPQTKDLIQSVMGGASSQMAPQQKAPRPGATPY